MTLQYILFNEKKNEKQFLLLIVTGPGIYLTLAGYNYLVLVIITVSVNDLVLHTSKEPLCDVWKIEKQH